MASSEKRGWTRWLWKADVTQGQKWVISVLLVVVLAALAPLLYRSFVPSPEWQHMAWYVVAGGMAVALLGLRHLYRTDQWRPSGPWVEAGPVKRIFLVLGMLGFMALMFWMVVAQSLPMAYTWLLGQEAQEQVTVEAERSSGRHSCRHQFKVQEISYLFFEFCISSDDYDAMPAGPMPAVLQLRRSYFGKEVHSLALSSASMAQDAAQEPEQDAQGRPLCQTTVTVGDQTTSTVEPC